MRKYRRDASEIWMQRPAHAPVERAAARAAARLLRITEATIPMARDVGVGGHREDGRDGVDREDHVRDLDEGQREEEGRGEPPAVHLREEVVAVEVRAGRDDAAEELEDRALLRVV